MVLLFIVMPVTVMVSVILVMFMTTMMPVAAMVSIFTITDSPIGIYSFQQ